MAPHSFTITRDQIIVEDRLRSDYPKLDDLVEDIPDRGLIQPIGLTASDDFKTFKLTFGGRRLAACDALGITEFTYGLSCSPGRAGFVIREKEADEPDELQALLIELGENFNRVDMDWRDVVKGAVKAYRLAKLRANLKGQDVLMRDFGKLLGTGYSDLRIANEIHDDLIANPEFYADCCNARQALAKLTKKVSDHVAAIERAALVESSKVSAQSEPRLDNGSGAEILTYSVPETVIDISSNFYHGNGLNWLRSIPRGAIDHIVTDPDYGVAIDVLESNMGDAAKGVAQTSPEQTLHELWAFLETAYDVLPDHGFCVFFYDLDHHEKLQSLARNAGFRVQRWPIIWHKLGHRSNAAPTFNFTKDIEYAMVCRMPNATLSKTQGSSVFASGNEGVVKSLNHPFAKPSGLWNFIYSAIAQRGQRIADPFCGVGSGPLAAIDGGYAPCGCEIQEQHYNNLIVNVQSRYSKLIDNVRFV